MLNIGDITYLVLANKATGKTEVKKMKVKSITIDSIGISYRVTNMNNSIFEEYREDRFTTKEEVLTIVGENL